MSIRKIEENSREGSTGMNGTLASLLLTADTKKVKK